MAQKCPKVGVFYIDLENIRSFKLNESGTVFQANILAVKPVADILIKQIKGRDISIHVDAQAAIKELVSIEIVKANEWRSEVKSTIQ